MVTKEEGIPAELNDSAGRKNPFDIQLTKNSLITILVCTALSVLFMKSGILSFFYLAPIGYAVIITGSIWIPFLSVAGTNIILDIFTRSSSQAAFAEGTTASSAWGTGNTLIEIFYFSSMFLLFIWVIGAKTPRTTYRLLAGSAAGAVVFLLLVYKTDFFSFLERFIEELNAQIAAGEETSVNPVLLGLIPAENMLELFNKVLLRGAAFFSILFIFFINRHMSYILVRLIKKRREDKPLTEFFAPRNAVWILSGAVASVLLAGVFKIELLEILAWNVLVICAVVFLAQGAGVLTHLLSKRSAGLRFGVSILFIFVLLSPISLAVIFMLLLLGIIENWIPIRKGRNQNTSYSEAN